MNVYARYFDNEIVAHSFEELWQFICSIEGLNISDSLRLDVMEYAEGKYSYAKRFKVNARNYFILIKTMASTLVEFKENANRENNNREELEREKEMLQHIITEEKIGWYEASLQFKRVLLSPTTGKFQYINTDFKAKLKARSIQDCYNRLIDHLRSRHDVDPRSQYPSIKGRNFQVEFLGV